MENTTATDKFDSEFAALVQALGMRRRSRSRAETIIQVGNMRAEVVVDVDNLFGRAASALVTVNWSSYGNVSLDLAQQFTTCMLAACELGRRAEAAFGGKTWTREELIG